MESGIQNPYAGIRNLEAGIRNPGPSWILLHRAKQSLRVNNKGTLERVMETIMGECPADLREIRQFSQLRPLLLLFFNNLFI